MQNPKKYKIRIVFFFNFFPEHFLSPFQRIPNQHKILRFLIPIPTMAFTKKENSGSQKHCLQILNAYVQKMVHFQTFCKKKKLIVFLMAFILCFNPLKFQKSIKLKPPIVTCTYVPLL